MRKNELGGNGSAFLAPTDAGRSRDFGIGVIGNSQDNVIEENGFGGNINGVLLMGPNTRGNMIRRNVFAGNPPTQVEVTFGPIGFDVQDNAPAGANFFEQNLCKSYFGPGENPCAILPNFTGHRNSPPGPPPKPKEP